MKNTGLRDGERYDLVENYTMKCRLYPSKSAAKKIDDAIKGASTFYNCILFDMFNNGLNLVEKPDKKNPDRKVHFPDVNRAMMASYKNGLVEKFPIIEACPQAALTTNVGVKADLKRSFGKNPIELIKPRFYSARYQRKSYTYQQALSTIYTKDNRNAIYISLTKIGDVKIKGWNKRIRFGENSEFDFLDYAINNRKEKITIVVSKDNCGDYWICFKLTNVYKPMKSRNEDIVGIDVGVSDIAITSDGVKYENKRFKKCEKKHLKALNRRLSRRNGFANEEFRKKRKTNKDLRPSKRYESVKLSHAKLERKIARKRNNYNHNISKDIVANHGSIAVESLNITGMFRNRHLAYALADASMGSLLQMIGYKSIWHRRDLKEIGKWTPSSKRCSCCGYVRPKLSLSTREWICPECGMHHDRDINAAINIKHEAFGLPINRQYYHLRPT